MSNRTLVTGAPGWLGTRLVEALTGKTTDFANATTIGARPVRVLVLPGFDASPTTALGAEAFEGDIRKPETLTKALEGVDTVFHLAGIIHPQKKIQEVFDINTEGTRNLLNAAIAAGVQRFIFVSSNSPAGCNKNRNVLLTESDPQNPYKAYGRSKAMAEDLVNKANAEGKIKTTIIRPCWFYGPNQPARQSRFFRMIKSGKPIVFGDGKNLRSMSYVDNTVQGLLRAESSSNAIGQTYWIADARPYETNEIYQTVAELLGVKLTPRFIPGIASDICELVDDALQAVGMYSTDFHVAGEMNKDIACSIEKARREIGYEPTIDLREGMRRSIEWCRSHGQEI
ncbi:MAG: NAD-dependent epimerase/dehydratase family protein [Patescibacteria group bacterium]|jgi:nucleoside-diphosphate-sugar epimerase